MEHWASANDWRVAIAGERFIYGLIKVDIPDNNGHVYSIGVVRDMSEKNALKKTAGTDGHL
jgi:hypothetical protein